MHIGEPYRRGKKWHFSFGTGDDRKESKPYDTESGAKRAITKMRNAAATADAVRVRDGLADIPPPDGTLGWWFGLLSRLARIVGAGGTADQRNDLRAVAQAAAAAKSLYDTTALEEDVAELKRFRREMELRREHGRVASG